MTIERVGVIGAGTMGNGIAQACAVAGIQSVMVDVSQAAVERGLATIGGSLDRLVKKDKLTAADKAAALARIKGTTVLRRPEGLRPRDRGRYREPRAQAQDPAAARRARQPETLIASNTSSISITQLAAVMPRPDRFIGMHFFNPCR